MVFWRKLLDTATAAELALLRGASLAPAFVRNKRTAAITSDRRTLLNLSVVQQRQLQSLNIPVSSTRLDGFFEKVFLVCLSENAVEPTSTELAQGVIAIDWPLRIGDRQNWPRSSTIRSVHALIDELCEIVVREQVTLIGAQEPFLRGPIGLAVARRTGLPLMLHVNQNYDLSSRAVSGTAFPPLRHFRMEQALERWVFSRADFVIAATQCYKDYALSRGAPLTRTFGIRNFVAPVHWKPIAEREDVRRKLGSPDRRVILYVGRLEPVKLVIDLVEMMVKVRQSRPDADLWIVGDGSEEGRLRGAFRRVGVDHGVHFLGSRPQDELLDIYASADVVVFPHGGVTIAEAALAGTPVVAYDHDWHPEIIGEDERGLLARFRSPSDLADKAVRVLDDDALAHRLANAALAFASETFRHDVFVNSYRRALSKGLTLPLSGAGPWT